MRADVLVIGAGTAGAAAAAFAAERGAHVICVDRRRLDHAGARWVNGVARWQLDAAGVDVSRADAVLAEGAPFHIVAGRGPERVIVRDHDVVDLDMRALVESLQTRAIAAGATLLGDVDVVSVEGHRATTSHGEIEADVLVDASGLSGLGARGPRVVRGIDVCAAAQEVRRVRDVGRARAFVDGHGGALGDVLCFTGLAGGYSVVNVRVVDDHVSLLTGSIPAEGHPSGRELLDDLVRREGWIGERVFGGTRAIPLRRPLARLVTGALVRIGDAACQVFPAHGSGVGVGLIAARTLAEALAAGERTEVWATAWQRGHAGTIAAFDVFRRFLQRLDQRELRRIIASGHFDEALGRAGLEQRWPRVDLQTVVDKARAAARDLPLAARLSSVLARMGAVMAGYARFPDDPAEIATWSRKMALVSGDGLES